MPPEETNKKNPPVDTLKVGIDPIFNKANIASVNQATASAYNVLSNQKYVPGQTPLVMNVNPVNNINNPKSIVRTFKGDLESAIAADHLSSVNIAIAENKKMRSQLQTERKNEENKNPVINNSPKNKILVFISLFLILAGIISVFFVFFWGKINIIKKTPQKELLTLITTEYHDELNTDAVAKSKFVIALANKLNDIQIPVNSLYNTNITIGTSTERRLITATEFISALSLKMPDIIRRTLLPEFMVGMYSYGKNLPFIIFKTSYFENAYAGMFDWEKYLERDFEILFRLPGNENNVGILKDLTPFTPNVFQDGVIVNKDVRLIRNENGEIIFLYGIIDKETIILTVNDDAFKEIITRLNNEKSLKR